MTKRGSELRLAGATAIGLLAYSSVSECVTALFLEFMRPADFAGATSNPVAALIWGIIITAPSIFLYFYIPLLLVMILVQRLGRPHRWVSSIFWIAGGILIRYPFFLHNEAIFFGALAGGIAGAALYEMLPGKDQPR
jgi:hypothetical protein